MKMNKMHSFFEICLLSSNRFSFCEFNETAIVFVSPPPPPHLDCHNSSPLIDWQPVCMCVRVCVATLAMSWQHSLTVASCNFVCGLRFNYVRQRAVYELLLPVAKLPQGEKGEESGGV